MPTMYQVFCDELSGMTWCPALGGETLEECVNNITNGVGSVMPSQRYMYYIYILHREKVPYWGKKPDVYMYIKTVKGTKVEPLFIRHTVAMQYALTTWEDGWLFTDKMWGV